MTTSKPMTGEQLDELMTVAVRMQRDAEVDRNFPSANFAYAVQVAVLELRRTREISSALAAENAGLNEKMNKLATWPGIEFYSSAWEFNGGDGDTALEFMCDTKTPATDAFLAEVRAQGVELFAREMHADISEADAIEFAAKLRKGAAQ
ncbi:hypothetical protein LEADMM068B1_03000 [Leclercia adecarboxylata]|uniref:hypothetical protein n=1 Tax=Leclercia adecarboxylata TaxID=83655 RepID=UPI001E28B044|nr:hypothetical protein [Leclercia adecarboxylata]